MDREPGAYILKGDGSVEPDLNDEAMAARAKGQAKALAASKNKIKNEGDVTKEDKDAINNEKSNIGKN